MPVRERPRASLPVSTSGWPLRPWPQAYRGAPRPANASRMWPMLATVVHFWARAPRAHCAKV
eukprot:7378171-Prymnesium_polylepis.1